jgi:biopolymer transport protein ExbB/TolQ
VSAKKQSNSVLAILGSLGWPLFLGLWAYAIFYVLVERGPLNLPLVERYFAGHLVSRVATAMFFVGIAALLLKARDLFGQQTSLARISLPEPPPEGSRPADCEQLIEWLGSLRKRWRRSYLARRLHDALSFVERNGSANGLEDELKYLADVDAARQQESYSLVRIIIWATPMLGFLGTVIGITQALGDLGTQELADDSLQTAMQGLLGGLYVAFDTTALALSLSIVLMFVLFLIERFETQLLQSVDARTGAELAGRFEQVGGKTDPYLASVEQMGQSMVRASEQLVDRQSRIWQSSLDEAQRKWSDVTAGSSRQVQEALANALDRSLARHAKHIAQVEQSAAEALGRRWEQWQVALSEGARLLRDQQKEMAHQGAALREVLQATADVVKLEQALNDNLARLAGSHHFEQMVMSLSAAIHLLNARLADLPAAGKQVASAGGPGILTRAPHTQERAA